MARPCTICTHPRRAEIDAGLIAGGAYRRVATQCDAAPESVRRHKEHVHAQIVKATQIVQAKDLRRGMTHLERMIAVADSAERLTKAAEKDGDIRAALVGLREIRETLKELIGIEAEAAKGMPVAVLESPEWVALRGRILAVLERHPDALRDVLDTLERG